MRPDFTGNNSMKTIPSAPALIEVMGQELEESLARMLLCGIREDATLDWMESEVFTRCDMN
jgi:hypothetical protein